ncbi:unnamed protein product [Symbiodinium natans]|uniref:Uncharacterized protein n=1 Tax=Symbiodinium natans TaxID=878477 RepID=A0A812M4E8_9DINO|nr:unnamed protein product [Symbiodinium natans]
MSVPTELPTELGSQAGSPRTAPPSVGAAIGALFLQRPNLPHRDDEDWKPDAGDPRSEKWDEAEPKVELWFETKDLKSLCRFARVHEARLHHATQRGLVGGSLA